jgi:hypothetical protein
MLPHELKAEQFSGYPPEARKLATNYLVALQRLPLSFLPSLLREIVDFDFKFPAERNAVEKELANLSSLSAEQSKEWFQGFSEIHLSAQLEGSDWLNAPAQFVEQLSAYLWGTHQLDTFRTAAIGYADRLRAAAPPEAPAIPRLGIAIVGQGVSAYDAPLFRKLRGHGVYFNHVKPEDGVELLLSAVAARAKAHPIPYAHWYIDGGREAKYDPAITCVSYGALQTARAALSAKMRTEIERPGMGPEALRSLMARMTPEDIGIDAIQEKPTQEKPGQGKTGDAVMARFQLKVLTEGSGTQIFSTTFAQWTAREALRRAQPLTMLVRFAPRQKQKPMNEMISGGQNPPELDPVGSLVDADFGAYYNFLNQQRLPGADQSSFLVWFEGHNEAVAIGPNWPRGTQSNALTDVKQLLG